jgi:hypothetical protein
MLKRPVCLVLGAGASAPYSFPTGGGLCDSVHNMPDDWWPLANELFGANRNYHRQFVTSLRKAGSPSLDHFIGKQGQYRDYVQALIAFRISEGESPTRIYAANANLDWARFLFQLIVDDADTLDEVAAAPLSVVSFNFDRSFEESALIRLSSMYGSPDKPEAVRRNEAAAAIVKWSIVHVHGSLGTLPEFAKGSESCRPYKHTLDLDALRRARERITLLPDAVDDSPEFQIAQTLIRDAEFTLFLGFGFHRLNCCRVLPRQWNAGVPEMHATIQGMTDGAIVSGQNYFRPHSFQAVDCDALELLRKIYPKFAD